MKRPRVLIKGITNAVKFIRIVRSITPSNVHPTYYLSIICAYDISSLSIDEEETPKSVKSVRIIER